MTLHKGFFALAAAAAALGFAARDASALAVTLTVDGCNNGSNVHTTVTFNCKTGLITCGKGKNDQLCGGIIFSASCSGPNLNNCPGNVINNDPPCDNTKPPTSDDGPNTKDIFSGNDGPKQGDNCDLHWKCPPNPCNPCNNDVPPPTPNDAVPDPTPLPSSMWGASTMMGALAFLHRLRRKARAVA